MGFCPAPCEKFIICIINISGSIICSYWHVRRMSGMLLSLRIRVSNLCRNDMYVMGERVWSMGGGRGVSV